MKNVVEKLRGKVRVAEVKTEQMCWSISIIIICVYMQY